MSQRWKLKSVMISYSFIEKKFKFCSEMLQFCHANFGGVFMCSLKIFPSFFGVGTNITKSENIFVNTIVNGIESTRFSMIVVCAI